jgi:hypothetical protein
LHKQAHHPALRLCGIRSGSAVLLCGWLLLWAVSVVPGWHAWVHGSHVEAVHSVPPVDPGTPESPADDTHGAVPCGVCLLASGQVLTEALPTVPPTVLAAALIPLAVNGGEGFPGIVPERLRAGRAPPVIAGI